MQRAAKRLFLTFNNSMDMSCALAEFGIEGSRTPGLTGVWVGSGARKIASIGVHARDWVTWHGFALKLQREGQVVKSGVCFTGKPPGPVLAEWRGKIYTVQVFPTGSILVLTGDQRPMLKQRLDGG